MIHSWCLSITPGPPSYTSSTNKLLHQRGWSKVQSEAATNCCLVNSGHDRPIIVQHDWCWFVVMNQLPNHWGVPSANDRSSDWRRSCDPTAAKSPFCWLRPASLWLWHPVMGQAVPKTHVFGFWHQKKRQWSNGSNMLKSFDPQRQS